LREKILTLLNQYRHKFGSNEFSLPFDRADMAIYLGADRSALSRELSKLKREGIIDFQKNHFIIK
jgi:CRP-like cAMP-binding protein